MSKVRALQIAILLIILVLMVGMADELASAIVSTPTPRPTLPGPTPTSPVITATLSYPSYLPRLCRDAGGTATPTPRPTLGPGG